MVTSGVPPSAARVASSRVDAPEPTCPTVPAAVAPGVSAPAALGVPLEVVLAVCERVARAGLPMVVDVVELCPRLDIDGRTPRAAARLIAAIAHELAG